MKKLICLAITAAVCGQSGELGTARATSVSAAVAVKEIQLHAPNSPEQTATVWVPAMVVNITSESTTVRNEVPKTIDLPALNSPVQSITVWCFGNHQKTGFSKATLKK
jgi:hypothetical protein